MAIDESPEAPEAVDVRLPDLPGQRTGGRHAARRTPVLRRLQVPVGRALALTAVPTALLMGGVSARMAMAADKTTATSTPDTTTTSSGSADCGGKTTSGSGTATPAASASATPGSSASPSASASPVGGSSTTSGSSGGNRSASTPTSGSSTPTSQTPTSAASPTAAPSSSPSPSASSSSGGGLLDILDPLHLLHGRTTTSSSSATPSASPSASASTSSSVVGAASKAVSGAVTSVTGKDSAVGSAASKAAGTVAGVSSAVGGTVSSVASTASDPSKLVSSAASAVSSPSSSSSSDASQSCDISTMAAPMDLTPGEFPNVTWNLKASQLRLYNTVFHGVVTVQTAAGPKRVLKFTAEAVDIDDLKMNAYQGANTTLHIDGGPGSTSTMRTTGGQEITMYVTQLTGTIAGIEGLPLPPILRVTLTPDTIPTWLYNIIGSLNVKLQLTLDNADIDQVGQTGGNLTIPGFHGYGVTAQS